MSFDTSFNLGPFEVDSMGHISPRPDNTASGFIFRWRGRSVRARLVVGDNDTNRLVLRVGLGRIPSTVLNQEADQRQRSFATLRAFPRSLPAGWLIRLMPDHQLRMETDTAITLPIAAVALVTDLTQFLLDLAPYLDLLDEIGVAPPSARADA